ncbi:MAG: carbonic anhydrase [Alphaproteobacteria bacterium]|nr:carbonic anhydrase [Alphaproteobacteria bacterium]
MLRDLLDNNRAWAVGKRSADPTFFRRLSEQQSPDYLWIGCSDSRVPANEIIGLDPGEVFVHRNVANLAIATDINFLSVLAFAVNVLKIKHIIVCGHYGCGGVRAAFDDSRNGVIDHWLEPVREIYRSKKERIDTIVHASDQVNALCEFNVCAQVEGIARTTIVRDAWARHQELALHGWIYGLSDGLVRDLDVSTSGGASGCDGSSRKATR